MLKNRMTKTTMKHIMRFNTTTIFQKFIVHRASQFGTMDDSRLSAGTSSPPTVLMGRGDLNRHYPAYTHEHNTKNPTQSKLYYR